MNWIQFSLKGIIFIQYCSYVLDIAAFMIPILTEDSLEIKIRCFAAFSMSVIQMYFFFYFANEIQVESTSVSDVIYNETNWTEATQKARATLLLMMIRSQQTLSLNSVAIGKMSLESFTKIMRICYSTCTFFTTIYRD
ncbi:odorant receptor Or2-like [Diorhabda sublineata]|uniref:odorant receptor Or2-like n=1 Tax=Diorhabda sublineata TaxID=1163346 RepID=UPI0024E14151|nr:odorant receptor Or2-like [Diorhabda sublineata]